jgi:cysteine desulfurase
MTVKLPIFMDYHSTTPVDPRVLEEMLPLFTTNFGNAASRSHIFGWRAEEAVEHARERIAQLIGAQSEKEIVFTSGATESDNLALKGVAEFYKDKGNHIITTVIEHKAVLDSCKRLEKEGFAVTYLGVGKDGLVDPDDVKKAITDKTILVSVMLANNEVGTIQPLAEIGKITREKGVLLHSDAVQGIGKTEFDVQKMNVDLASITAHKMYGPKGCGALYVRRSKPRVRIVAQMDGGGHERGMRSGTLNVPSIVGFGRAADTLRLEGERGRGAPLRATREAPDVHPEPPRRGLRQRIARAPASRQPQHLLQLRRGRRAHDGHQGRRGELRLGVHVGQPRAELRAPGDGPR